MRKAFVIFSIVLIFLAGCAKDDANEKETAKKEDSPIVNEESENKETEDKEESVQEEHVDESEDQEKDLDQFMGIDLKEYRPNVGAKKTFTENGNPVFTEEVIAANDQFVQMLVQLGGNQTTQIYKWTGSEITLVFEERSLEDPKKSLLDGFEQMANPEKLIGDSAVWEMVENSSHEKTPYGELKDVIVVRKVTDEVVNEKTTYTRFFAPELGLVKETYSLTGENGYSAESVLGEVK
ncbi:hypothetical protein [Bacillus sp. ISL-55]|uniref:hypothetical protein n=1 Tax=Bacillus sp. ISL-55 TaxID=2819134 RepID=UPI001BEBE46D|nr:hypothetical protein [Bacillus sp. ISL-55]MBT2693706.1 hypothetical protein [Bacillus sp. ISL-55]